MARKIYRFLVRVSAFLGKEIFTVLRQPMLALTLVLGPFLILLLFGLGFRNEPPALRTLFVVPAEEDNLIQRIEAEANTLGPQLIFMGITHDRAEATAKLLRREIDVVAVVPPNGAELIRNSQPVVIELEHYEIDPFKIDYVNIFGQVYADEINRRVLRSVTQQGQQETTTVYDSLKNTQATVAELRTALSAGDEVSAQQHKQQLAGEVNLLALTVGATLGLTEGVQDAMGQNENVDTQNILTLLSALRDDTNALDVSNVSTAQDNEVEKLDKIEGDLADLEALLGEFQSIDADVLISPFRSEAKSISPVQIRPSDFFAPAVIALLLQHLSITLGALSIVQEHQRGAMELFRVSPISAFETLLGKYLSYMLFAGVLAAVLTLMVIYGLGVPMLGQWLSYALTVAGLVFASLGIGFVISLVAKTDSEAVQYSMIVLLTSVFFSGAFVNLESLWQPVRVVGWLMPATYGILLLQNIMLRGFLANAVWLLGLTAFGVGFFVLAWLLLRRLMARG
ncbi:MAG: ABC transporter permease [Anaerolineae bacterium]|nr:ABC transporter permease [Anaerolineae bacterium]